MTPEQEKQFLDKATSVLLRKERTKLKVNDYLDKAIEVLEERHGIDKPFFNYTDTALTTVAKMLQDEEILNNHENLQSKT